MPKLVAIPHEEKRAQGAAEYGACMWPSFVAACVAALAMYVIISEDRILFFDLPYSNMGKTLLMFSIVFLVQMLLTCVFAAV